MATTLTIIVEIPTTDVETDEAAIADEILDQVQWVVSQNEEARKVRIPVTYREDER